MSELHKFVFEGLPVRGMVVRLTDVWQEILRRRANNLQSGAYPAPVRHLLGEMTAAAALMHLAAAVPAVDWGVSISNQYLADDIVRATIKVVDGHAEVPAGVGLGVEVDEAKVRKYTRTV